MIENSSNISIYTCIYFCEIQLTAKDPVVFTHLKYTCTWKTV